MRDSLEGVLRKETETDAFKVLVGTADPATRRLNVRDSAPLSQRAARQPAESSRRHEPGSRGASVLIVRVDGHGVSTGYCVRHRGHAQGRLQGLGRFRCRRRVGDSGGGDRLAAVTLSAWHARSNTRTRGEADTLSGRISAGYLRKIGGTPVRPQQADDVNSDPRTSGGRVLSPPGSAIYQGGSRLGCSRVLPIRVEGESTAKGHPSSHAIGSGSIRLRLLLPLLIAPWERWIQLGSAHSRRLHLVGAASRFVAGAAGASSGAAVFLTSRGLGRIHARLMRPSADDSARIMRAGPEAGVTGGLI